MDGILIHSYVFLRSQKVLGSNDLIHEHVVLKEGSSCGLLRGHLLHYTYQNPSQMQRKAIHYSNLYAEAYRFKRRIGPWGVAAKAFFAFWRSYLLQGGFLEGYVGLLISRAISDGTFYRYLKLMEENRSLRCSLIITTYNRPSALKEILESVRRQSLLPTEVIIADDGSSEETRQLILSEQASFPVPLYHCWQEDKGFRPSRNRNKAIALAKGEYIAIIDGDIVLHKHFIRNQQQYCRKGWLIHGSRVFLNNSQTKKILKKGWTGIPAWQRIWIRGIKGLYFPLLSNLVSRRMHKIYGIRGCIISFWREDAYAINGYNEEFEGWGREDKRFFCSYDKERRTN